MILINVLLFVAIAAGVVMLMISAEDGALQRSLRLREAARALAIAHGGEQSAITALRRDATVAADNDNPSEPWSALAARDQPIAGGRFDLAIADATGRFNVNAVMSGDAAPIALLGRIADSAGVPPDLVATAIALIRRHGPVADLRPLRSAGLPDATFARIAPLLTALPYDSKVNVNAAGEPLLAILLNDAAAARRLVAVRQRNGRLTPADFDTLSLPAGAAFTSDLYWVRTRVRISDTAQQLTSLLVRRHGADGNVTVVPVGRWLGSRPPDQAPALP